MSEAIRWWLVLELIAGALLPLCLALFRRLPDRGYSLSKPFGLLFVGYTFWLLNSAHLLPNSNRGVLAALLLLALVSGWFAYRERDDLVEWLRTHWQYIVGVEAVFIVVFAVAVWARSLVGFANITEQPMDLMFVNAATRAEHFPPNDPWLSGHTVSYYYFGYLIVAMTGRLAGVPTDVAYNLGFAMVPALAFVGAAGIVYNLVAMRESAGGDAAPANRPVAATRTPRRDRRAEARAPARTLYAALGVTPRVSGEQITQSYELLRTRLVAAHDDESAAARLAEVSAAYDVLGDPGSRREYDRSLRTGSPPVTAPAPASDASAERARTDAPGVAAPAPGPPAAAAATRAASMTWRPPVFGLIGGCLLVLIGNLEYALEFASAYGIGGKSFYDWIDVRDLTAGLPRHDWYPSSFFGFFRASRIYQLDHKGFQGITEFPMFSFVLGDLHPHVMALPFVLLVVGVALSLYRSPEPLDITFWLERPLALLATAILLGALAFLNTWDIATLAFVVVAAAFVSNFMRVRRLTADLFVQIGSFALPLLVLAVVMYVPFYAGFTSQANGIGAVVSNDGVTVPATRPLYLFLFWGPLFVVVIPFVVARLVAARDRISVRLLAATAAPAVAVVAGWALLLGYEQLVDSDKLGANAGGLASQITDRGAAWLTFLFLGCLLAAALAALWLELTDGDDRGDREGVVFTLVLAATAVLLILGTEFFFVGDVFNNRMNSVFKLYYQAWMMLAIAGGFSLYYLASRWHVRFPRAAVYRAAWAGAAIVVLALAALYPLGAAFNRAHTFDGDFHATAFLSTDERSAIAWLDGRVQGQDLVIAEAAGNDYFTKDTFGRISMATGAPTILGWKGHEDQWRSGNCTACAGRFEDVNSLYTTTDSAVMQQILQKYGVTYVYVGDVERRTYGEAGMEKFSSLPVVFQCGAVTIYRAKGGGPGSGESCKRG